MKIDLYSICYNEEVILPYFIKHYSTFVSNITIYDNYSTDNSDNILKESNCNVIKYDSNNQITFTYKSKDEIKSIVQGDPYNTFKYNETAITCNTSGEGSALYFAMIAILYYPLEKVRTFEGSWNVWNNLYSKKPYKYPSNIPPNNV